MPWLIIHVAFPIVLLAGRTAGEFVQAVDWSQLRRWEPAALVGLFLAVVLLLIRTFAGDVELRTVQGLSALLLFGLLLFLLFQLVASIGLRLAALTAALIAFAALIVLTLRFSTQASYAHGDIPMEMLVYTQTSPDIPDIMKDIERLARARGDRENLPITVDAAGGFTWPWAWYLRDYKKVDYPDLTQMQGPPAGAVLLLNATNEAVAQPYLGSYGPGQRFKHRWWFPEDYRGWTPSSIWQALTDQRNWGTLGRFLLYRELPSPLGSSDGIVYFPKDFQPGGVTRPSVPDVLADKRLAIQSILTIGGRRAAEPGSFNEPKGIAIDRQGNIYVADAQNHRIQKLDPQGRVLQVAGGQGAAPGQFNEPWGIAVHPSGNVYVADTWNHRVQRFDSDLRFLNQWGEGLSDNRGRAEGNEGRFYGPRSVAIDADGNLLVSDTGNKRIQKFDPEGRFLASYGGAGNSPGRFQEPVGLAIDAQGNVYVADTWNRRVQKLDRTLQFLQEVSVPGWQSQSVLNKPYLATSPTGEVWVTDPETHRVLAFDPFGQLTKVVGGGIPALNLPVGIAFDADGNLLISEAGGHRVQKFAAADVAR
jgi:DNA-binding beta-propeller fold protein YncE